MPPRKKDKNGKPILTVKEQRFVEGVARGKSRTQAAKDAGYSKKSAADIGKKNPQKPLIQNAIQERIQAVKATTDEVLSLFAVHLRGDFGDFTDDCWEEDGRVKWKTLKSKGLSRLVKKHKRTTKTIWKDNGETETTVNVELELYDAQAAGRTLAEIAGLKQQPRENDTDKKDRRQFYESLVQRLIDRAKDSGETLDREVVIQRVLEREPEAAKYLM